MQHAMIFFLQQYGAFPFAVEDAGIKKKSKLNFTLLFIQRSFHPLFGFYVCIRRNQSSLVSVSCLPECIMFATEYVQTCSYQKGNELGNGNCISYLQHAIKVCSLSEKVKHCVSFVFVQQCFLPPPRALFHVHKKIACSGIVEVHENNIRFVAESCFAPAETQFA